MRIGKFSVNNSVMVNILMLALLALGGITLLRMPQEQFSEVPFYFAVISVPWPGVSAEEVERQVLIPIEEKMQDLMDLDEITSFASEGMGIVSIRFNDGISQSRFDKLFNDVNTRFPKVILPEGTKNTSVDSFSSNDFAPVVEIVLSGDVGYDELVLAAENMAEPLKRIPEVSDVELIGVRDKKIVISANMASLSTRGISINQLVQAVESRNQNIPGGTLVTDTQNYLIRTVGAVNEIDELGDTIIRYSPDTGSTVRVGDVSDIFREYDRNGKRVRMNGKTAITLRVTKIPRGNTVKIINAVKDSVNQWQNRISPDISLEYQNDSSLVIQSAIRILLNNAVFGLIFLIILLLLFVGLRNALITALGIPTAFAITFILLDITGQTFNTNTLFGMVLVLGMIVDHAIVITENSFRLRHTGLSRREAAILGTDQVAVPILAAALTTVAAFLPLMLLPGIFGKFLRVIPLTVTLALLASTGEALFFLPSHYADWPEGRKHKAEGRIFVAFRRAYRRFAENFYKRRKLTVVIILVGMLASFFIVPILKQDLFRGEDAALVYIDITMPPGTPMDRTDRISARFEERLIPLAGNGEVTGINTAVGFLSGSRGNEEGAAVAQIVVNLVEENKGRSRSVSTILAEIRNMTEDIPGPDKVIYRKAIQGPPTDPPVSFRLFGDRYPDILLVADRIRSELAKEPDILNIEDNFEPGTPELRVRVNEERAASYGLTLASVGQYMRASIEGIEATSFFKDNKSWDVIVRFAESTAFEPALLTQLSIPTSSGNLIPFTAVARLENGDSLASIKRLDGRREVTITADAYTKDNIPAINQRISDIWEAEYASRFPSIEFSVGGEFAEFNDLLIQILRIFLVGIFLIYLILGTQFRSYIQPLLISFSVPLAFSGVLVYLLLSGNPFSLTVLYAGVALAGISVNDAIVLISFINEQRADGKTVSEAVVNAAEIRLRPILLTSLTTIAGLAPTALGLGGKSIVWSPMAGTIIFGLIFSTTATLVFIPALYGTLFDRRKKLTHHD